MQELVKERINRLISWSSGKIAPPFKMLLYPTNKCNLRCIYCNNTYIRRTERYKNKVELSLKEWEGIVYEGLSKGIREWWIQGGGEPLMALKKVEMIVEMIKGHKEKNKCMITTNGTLFNERIIKKFVKLGLDEINFSISSPDREVDNFLRGRKAFERSTRSIELFNRYKKKERSDKPLIRINSILTSKIYDRIEAFLLLCSNLGVNELVLNPLRLQAEVVEEIDKGNEQIKNLVLSNTMKKNVRRKLKKISKKGEELGVKLVVNGIDELRPLQKPKREIKKEGFTSSFCFEPFLTILIGPLGEVGCCCGYDYENSPVNIRNKTLNDIWTSKFFRDIRERMLKNLPMSNCSCCGFKEITERLREEFINAKKEFA